MKTITRKFIGAIPLITVFALILAARTDTFAIEGLQISVQAPDVILGWPSSPDETYIVQWRPALGTGTPLVTLTSSLPADSNTNWTVYVDSGRIQSLNNNSSSSMVVTATADDSAEVSYLESITNLAIAISQPLVIKADGSGALLPLGLYPPGTDLSTFIIIDPSTGDSVSGSGYIVSQPHVNAAQLGDMEPMDDAPEDPPADPGFYQVVRVGPHLIGFTNGMALSGVWLIPVEAGSPDGQLVTVTLTKNGSPVGEDAIHVPPFELPVPLVVLDTTRMSNGVHQVAAIARWQIGGSTNEEVGGFFEADCPPISIVVSNEVFFPNWMPYFGQLDNTLLISAQSAHTDTDWMIDIYGANAGYIGTFTGHTYDGDIYGWWDLVGPPPDSISYTNEPWFQFKVSTPYIDPPTPKTYKQTDGWPSPGRWVIVAQHAFDSILDHETLSQASPRF